MSSPAPLPDSGNGGPIVLVHGDFGDGFESWGSACALIGRRRRTVVIDRPGFGEDFLGDAWFSFRSPWGFHRFISSGIHMAA
jgi:pimeloyl-ACP methyl ester carboxylesterase